MFKFLRVRRQNDRPSTQRPRLSRRPMVEDLEGRQLQSGIVGNHIGMAVSSIQGAHIGSNAAVQGAHIGMAELGGGGVGRHIG